MARRTRGSPSGGFFVFMYTAWMTLWLSSPTVIPGVSFARRQLTGSRIRP